jgi:hypothetical protein
MMHKPYQSVVLLLACGLALHAAPYSPSRVHFQQQQPFEKYKMFMQFAKEKYATTSKDNIHPLVRLAQQDDCPLSDKPTFPEAFKVLIKFISSHIHAFDCNTNPGEIFNAAAKLIKDCSKRDGANKDMARKEVNRFHLLANIADTLLKNYKYPDCKPRSSKRIQETETSSRLH